MKLDPNRPDIRSATIAQSLWLIVACSLLFAATTYAASTPGWWSSRGALNADPPNDSAVFNEGQLKQFTQKAVQEMNADLPGGAGTNLNNLVAGWTNDYYTNGYTSTNAKPSDYQPIRVGQLKYIANMVYSRLIAAGYITNYPSWIDTNVADGSMANIGQLKTAFSFDPTVSVSPVPVTGLTSTLVGVNEIDLAWTPPSSTPAVTRLLVQQQNGDGSWTTIHILPASASSYVVTGLTLGHVYTYRIMAVNYFVENDPAAAVSATSIIPKPPWWISRSAINTNAPDDYAAVTEGQLKQFTQKAVLEMNAKIFDGAGSELNDLVTGWTNDYSTNGYTAASPKPSDRQLVNTGQLKWIASKIYNRLYSQTAIASLPTWLDTNAADSKLANLGQLKTVFNFILTEDDDTQLINDLNFEVDGRIQAAGTASAGTESSYNSLLDSGGLTYTGGNMSVFSSIGDTSGSYVRNSGAWTGSLDLSGVSAFRSNSDGGTGLPGLFGSCLTLITPTDAITANHVTRWPYTIVGSTYTYVDNSNAVYTATVASVNQGGAGLTQGYDHCGVGGTVGSVYTDIAVVHLTWSPSVPTTLKVYKILPSNYQDYSPIHDLGGFPIFVINQFRQIFCQNAVATAFHANTGFPLSLYHGPSSESNRSSYSPYSGLITGDSGWPVFCVIRGEPVFIGSNFGTTSCPSVADYATAINSALSSLGSTNTVTTVDLSAFTTY